MKKLATIFPLFLLAMACCVLPAAASNQVTELAVEVSLREDGSAYITQTFSAVTDEGTEFYLDYLNSGYLSITDLQVSDENGSYQVLDTWDVDASFEDKAGKCGQLAIDGGDELCWGITQYGEHRYTVEYVLHDLVGAYTDADGFNYRFVNADLGFFPTDVTLTIRSQNGDPLTGDNCRIWAFGYEGQIQFQDGAIFAWTESPLEGSENMTILVELDKGVLSPARTVEDSFQPVKDAAMEDSDYEKDVSLVTILLGILGACVLFVAVVAVLYLLNQAKLNRLMKNTPYFRDAPNGGNLNVTYRLCLPLDLCQENSLLGARMLRLIAQGALEPVSQSMDDSKVELRLVKPPQKGDDFDGELYSILQAAAGDDGVLQPKELETYSYEHWGILNNFLQSCNRNGNTALVSMDCLKGAECTGLKSLTEQGKAQLAEILGLKRFLLDFSLIRERYAGETILWQDYMVYAMLLGIADKVAAQLKNLYPAQIQQVELYQQQMLWADDYGLWMYRSMERHRREMEAEARSEGLGGQSSLGGGGGFSGGGGGGTR